MFGIYWTFASIFAILISVLAIAKNGRRSGAYVFGHFDPVETASGWTPGWSFMVGLLHAAYATSSTGMVISMCEEVQRPAIQVPRAMVLTICFNTIGGLLFLLPLMFVLPDLASVIVAQPVPIIIKEATGSTAGAFVLCMTLVILGILCGTACTTATSRCTWAFSRDGAIPGSKWWKKVNTTLDVPLNAMMLSLAVQVILGVIYFGSAAAFNAFSGVGVISLTASYASPIVVSMLEGRRQVKSGKFFLGKFGWVINGIAIGWSLLALPLFCMPAALPVTAETVNYAPVVFVAFVALASFWYFVWGRKNYQGPPKEEIAETMPTGPADAYARPETKKLE